MQEQRNLPMRWSVGFDEATHILHARVSGEMTTAGIMAMAAELLEESNRRHAARCLCDCRGVSVKIDFSEIYNLPTELRRIGVTGGHVVAVIYSVTPVIAPLFSFFDDRAFNAGLTQKAFTDIDEARIWLAGNERAIHSSLTRLAV